MAEHHPVTLDPVTPDPVTLDLIAVAAVLRAARYHYANEDQLQQGIAVVLARRGIAADREVRLSPADRIDFLLTGCPIGIEVKVDGQAAAVWRQLRRYAASPQVSGLLLATTRTKHEVDAPSHLDGVPVHVLVLRGGL